MPLDPLEIIGGLAIGEGLGGAISDTVEPRLQDFKNSQWSAHQDVPLDAATAAEVAAEDVSTYPLMTTEASFTGYDSDRFANLYGVTLNAPGMGELLAMLRRSDEVSIDFAHGLRKARLESQWDDALRNLRDVRIPATDLAYMVVRDIVPDPFGFAGPSGPDDNTISDLPQLQIDTLAEAAKTGWDPLRFEALFGRSGLAPAPVTAANSFFRGIANYDQYLTMIKKGDLRPAYANVILNTARQILTAGEYAELQLRGFSTAQERRANTAKHGMSTADSDLLYDVLGRAPAIKQVYIGLARGGTYDGQPKTIPEPFLSAVQRANIRPEWYDIEYALRYSLPSAFVVRSLLKDGAIDATRGSTILQHEGWPPDLADLVANHYAASTTAAADPHVAKAATQLWTTTHASYKAEEIDDSVATAALTAAGVAPTAIPAVLTLWKEERALIRKQLSPTQIRKALNLGIVNPATGVVWTQADAEQAMLARGWDLADAQVFLQE